MYESNLSKCHIVGNLMSRLKCRCVIIWENPAQFENRIKPRVFLRCIARSTMYEQLELHFVSWISHKEN